MSASATVFDQFRYDPDAFKGMNATAKQAMGDMNGRVGTLLTKAKKPAQFAYEGAEWVLKMLHQIMMAIWRGVVNVCRALCGLDSMEKEQERSEKAFKDAVKEAGARGELGNVSNLVQPAQAPAQVPSAPTGPALGLPMPTPGLAQPAFAVGQDAQLGGFDTEHPVSANESVVYNEQEADAEKKAFEIASKGFLTLMKRLDQALTNEQLAQQIKELMDANQGQEVVNLLTNSWAKEIEQGEALARRKLSDGIRTVISQHSPDMEDLENKVNIIVGALPENIAWDIFQDEEIEALVTQHLESHSVMVQTYLPFRSAVSVLSSARVNDYEQFSHSVSQLMQDSAEVLGNFDDVEMRESAGAGKGYVSNRERATKGA